TGALSDRPLPWTRNPCAGLCVEYRPTGLASHGNKADRYDGRLCVASPCQKHARTMSTPARALHLAARCILLRGRLPPGGSGLRPQLLDELGHIGRKALADRVEREHGD